MELKDLVRLITAEVIAQLKDERLTDNDTHSGEEVLVLITAGHSIWPKVSYKLREMRNRGLRLNPVLSEAAKNMFDSQELRSVFGGRSASSLYEEKDVSERPNPLEMIKRSAAIILPTLTMNTVAKLALGIQDTLITQLTAWALLQNKPVVAVSNAANPNSAELSKLGFAFKSKSQSEVCLSHLEKLSSYGIQLVDADYLLPAVLQAVGRDPINPTVANAMSASDPLKPLVVEGALTREKVLRAVGLCYREIVAKGVVTPLAKETASEHNIRISS
ncbi:hypothetical protein JCM15765_12780 [Paradesulfitobacterium aromaticivorans]